MLHKNSLELRPPGKAEVQIMHDYTDVGGRAMPGAIAEEQLSAAHRKGIELHKMERWLSPSLGYDPEEMN